MDTMSDVEKRREARRRKILENSEERLKKISCDTRNKTVDDGKCKSRDSLSKQNLYAQQNTITRRITSDNSSFNEEENNDQILNSAAEKVTSSSRLNCDKELHNGIVQHNNSFDAYSFPKKVSDAETRSYGRTRADSRRNSSCTQLMKETLNITSLKISFFRPWLLIAVAVIVKFFFLLYSSNLFMLNIFFPFLLLEVAIFAWMKINSQDAIRQAPQTFAPGSFILLLCGVPSSAVSALTYIWNILQYLLHDFALYLFSFVFVHVFCECYIKH